MINADGRIFRTEDGGDIWTKLIEKPGTFFRSIMMKSDAAGLDRRSYNDAPRGHGHGMQKQSLARSVPPVGPRYGFVVKRRSQPIVIWLARSRSSWISSGRMSRITGSSTLASAA